MSCCKGLLQVICCGILVVALGGCASRVNAPIHFTVMPPPETGIGFRNTLTEDDSANLMVNEYTYMGGGVGIGDFNNDGLPDIFFTASQQPCRLYINKEHLKFEDITDKSGISGRFWATGVSVVDVNGDGYDDIYVCASGTQDPYRRSNRLYINNGHLGFTEQAADYGLADTGYSTQAIFFDYDRDGDLDMYLVNHLLFHDRKNQVVERDLSGRSPANDRLYRNEGVPAGGTHPVFRDVSEQAGIREDGYGLGAVVSDLNNDGWPDIYVTNDYIGNDVLWLNNRNGSFTNTIAGSMRHQSYSSMGVDAADISNDGLPDVVTLDMLPETNERKKMMFSFLSNERYEMERRTGYEPEFMRNMLQLNLGNRAVHDTVMPFFSEIGQLAGIHATDWSWSVLMADLDNDGWKDMHITNGMGRDFLNSDFIAFRSSVAVGQYANDSERNSDLNRRLSEYGSAELASYLFRNNGHLGFSNISPEAGFNTPAVSNGCAYADLDNDGDLDLVVNNINKEAFVFRNDLRDDAKNDSANYLTIHFRGTAMNRAGFGSKVKIYAGGNMQMDEQEPVRGYCSSVDQRLHFGLGKAARADSLEIVWPDGRRQMLRNVPVNRVVEVKQEDATESAGNAPVAKDRLFGDVTTGSHIDFKHRETFFFDYDFQRSLPQKYSQLGPFITVGDINGDGLIDLFVGGAYHQWGRFFIQRKDGRFDGQDLLTGSKEQEDTGCLLFDADGDGDQDLLVNSGGYEFEQGSPNYVPRLYINDGTGHFRPGEAAIPATVNTSAQAVAAIDYDGDGDADLFIGGRISPGQYPVSPRSYILQNDHGRFSDVTARVCPALHEAGMVTSSIVMDIDKDGHPDLIIAGEWMSLRFFMNRGGRLEEVTAATGLQHMSGQWRSLCAADLDGDGDEDIVAGNLGLNDPWHASPAEPMKLLAKDIDGNGSIDPVLCYYLPNKKGQRRLYPAISRDQFARQVPAIKNKFFFNSDYAGRTADDIFSGDREGLLELTCEETRSCWLENKGNGKFIMHALPLEAQFAPVNAIVCTDADGDGKMDILIAGNEYQAEVMTGRYDASYGLFLKGDGKGSFTPVPPVSSGFIIDGDVKDMQLITTGRNEKMIIAGINDEKLKAFGLKEVKKPAGKSD